MRIPVPPFEDQNRFSRLVKSHNPNQRNVGSRGKYLETLFSALLHRAFTGDLTAKWREAYMKELLAEMEEQAKVLGLNES